MGKKKKYKKAATSSAEIWTEEQYEEYMKELYGMEFIAGFTENGVPYGVFNTQVEENAEFMSGRLYTTGSIQISHEGCDRL